ncbi:glycosyltransferase family 4 protein [Gemmata sp. G18]|uniref:Glycosyltransferase family 4 protein n=1 Tax=Gemmata palustris TaxID=2822762 RepID=A0ABS5C367_9BACT|nr:glycosyltransferase family 4 protein [Gemmata palustris]MBP3960348.1 glycosyltransferase family 4 protein [Gemmata palustris]
MRLVALVESESHVCCRYRLTAFRSALKAAGHTLDFRPIPQSLFGRAALGRDLTSYDAVILQRKLLPRWVTALLRRRVQRLIFDFDDAVWLRDSYSAKGFDDPKRSARFRATVEACDLVIAGNSYLAEEARKFVPADRVTVIPTCVDVAKYRVQEQETRTSGIRLVWVGSASTLQGLERFGPTLSAIGRAVPGTRLKLICDRFAEFPDLPVERCTWTEATEAAEIASADIGIGWVPDDPWSRGKCALKVLQYQTAGLPVVANPVGVQADFVRDGETGFRANSTDEWVHAIRVLAADAALRKRLGETAHRDVEAHYSVEAGAKLWIESLARFETVRMAG